MTGAQPLPALGMVAGQGLGGGVLHTNRGGLTIMQAPAQIVSEQVQIGPVAKSHVRPTWS